MVGRVYTARGIHGEAPQLSRLRPHQEGEKRGSPDADPASEGEPRKIPPHQALNDADAERLRTVEKTTSKEITTS